MTSIFQKNCKTVFQNVFIMFLVCNINYLQIKTEFLLSRNKEVKTISFTHKRKTQSRSFSYSSYQQRASLQ